MKTFITGRKCSGIVKIHTFLFPSNFSLIFGPTTIKTLGKISNILLLTPRENKEKTDICTTFMILFLSSIQIHKIQISLFHTCYPIHYLFWRLRVRVSSSVNDKSQVLSVLVSCTNKPYSDELQFIIRLVILLNEYHSNQSPTQFFRLHQKQYSKSQLLYSPATLAYRFCLQAEP